MKRTLSISLLALALAVPAVAWGAFRSGTYSGRTAKGSPVSFRVTQASLSRFKIAVLFTCTDGDRFSTVLDGFPAQGIAKRRGVGRYEASFSSFAGANRYTNRGTILNRRATGTFTGTRTYNAQGDPDVQGTIVCTTGTLRYTARRPYSRR